MKSQQNHTARVSMLIEASPAVIFNAFIDPQWLVRFWLSAASAPLNKENEVRWDFMVTGASVKTRATRLDAGKGISWQWSDGSVVDIDFEAIGQTTAVTLVNTGFAGDEAKQVQAALNATEGFSIVLCDLKTLLEAGQPAGLTAAKAKLIEARGGA